MDAGVRAPALPDRCMGEQCQRRPTNASGVVRESPYDLRRGQAGSNMRITVHTSGVIDVDKLVARCLTEDETDGQQEQTADGQCSIAVLSADLRSPEAVSGREDSPLPAWCFPSQSFPPIAVVGRRMNRCRGCWQ